MNLGDSLELWDHPAFTSVSMKEYPDKRQLGDERVYSVYSSRLWSITERKPRQQGSEAAGHFLCTVRSREE